MESLVIRLRSTRILNKKTSKTRSFLNISILAPTSGQVANCKY